jgi:asparagine synthase (glutamine-hydrolysing)
MISQKKRRTFCRSWFAWNEPIADNVCIRCSCRAWSNRPATVVQVGEGADENFLGYWWCEHYRQKQLSVYDPARQSPSWWQRVFAKAKASTPGVSGEDLEIIKRAESGQELFWGGAVCWWGDMRSRLTPNSAPFQQSIDCRSKG